MDGKGWDVVDEYNGKKEKEESLESKDNKAKIRGTTWNKKILHKKENHQQNQKAIESCIW